MASRGATKKLTREYSEIMKNPITGIQVAPQPDNILIWHYVLMGPEDSPYHKGVYYGILTFPDNYPMAPPAIKMITPNGRFKPDKRICTTMSDYHPESWSPVWTLGNILVGLLSFMLDKENAVGCVDSDTATKKNLAAKSLEYNLKKISVFSEYFPELK